MARAPHPAVAAGGGPGVPSPAAATRLCCVLLAAGLAGCGGSREAKLEAHQKRADASFEREKYAEAAVEYRNVLQLDRTNLHAMARLGRGYYKLGEMARAYPYLLKVRELAPGDARSRLTLGTVLLLANKPAEARAEADCLLDIDPQDFEAFMLLAESSRTPEEFADTIRRMDEVASAFSERANFHLARGHLLIQVGRTDEAEKSFNDAVAAEPESVEARLLLGQFYQARGEMEAAGEHLRKAVELEPSGGASKVRLAEYYLRNNQTEEAKATLIDAARSTEEFDAQRAAQRLLAAIHIAERQIEEAERVLNLLLANQADDLNALLMRGQLNLGRGNATDAIRDFKAVLARKPKTPSVLYELGRAQAQAGQLSDAKSSLEQARALAPGFVDVALLLASLNLQTGDFRPAIALAETATADQPKRSDGYELLAVAYLAVGEPKRALEVATRFLEIAPGNSHGLHLQGTALSGLGKEAEAVGALEAALAAEPAYAQPLAQLVKMAFARNDPDGALERVRRQVALAPYAPGLFYILGEVHLRRGEVTEAGAEFARVKQLDPNAVLPYAEMARAYARGGSYDQAVAQLEPLLRGTAGDAGILTMLGILHEQKGDRAAARAAYEKAIAVDAGFATALNNLANILAADGDLERASKLAGAAHKAAPLNAAVADTYGWLLYKQGAYQPALSVLIASADKLKDSAEAQYHLAAVQDKLGNHAEARRVAARALELSQSFPGADEARGIVAQAR